MQIKKFVEEGQAETCAIIESANNQFYITYSPDTCPCHCGAFQTLEEALQTIKRHRPLAKEA